MPMGRDPVRSALRSAALVASVWTLSAPALAQSAQGAGSLRGRFGIAQWTSRISHPDAAIRRPAVRALGAYAPADATLRAPLFASLSSRLMLEAIPEVQEAIVEALYALDAEQAAVVVRSALLSRGVLRGSAVDRAFERMGPGLDGLGVDELARALARGVIEVPHRPAAIGALASAPELTFSERISNDLPAEQLAVMLEAIGVRGDGRWGSVVLEQLAARSALVQVGAIRGAVGLRLLESARPIATLARRAERQAVRIEALEALASVGVGDREATRDALAHVLGEASASAAELRAARAASAALGERALVSVVSRGLAARWSVERREVAETLGALGGGEALVALLGALRSEGDSAVRRSLWRAAIRVDEAGARRALAGTDDPLATWVSLELGMRTGAFVVTSGLRARAERGEPAAWALLCATSDCGLARDGLRSTDAAARARAAWALSWARDESTAASVIAALERESERTVRYALSLALGRWSSGFVTRALVAGWRRAEGGLERAMFAELLARRGDRAAREGLSALLEDEHAAVRALALGIAVRTQDPEGLAAARRLEREDPSDAVRAAARRALGHASGLRQPSVGERSTRGFDSLHVTGLRGHAPVALWLPGGEVILAMTAEDGTLLAPAVPSRAFELEVLGG
jgi:hypothetical protein